jgi:S1-C subfamily serine protease
VIGNPTHYAEVSRFKRCTLVGTSPGRDLALLKLVEPMKCKPIRLSDGTNPGQRVFVIGANTKSIMWHYADGAVRQVFQGSYKAEGGGEVRAKLIEMTSPINAGDSGGPIMNQSGELVGIVLATDKTKNQIHTGIHVAEVRAFLIEILTAELLERLKQEKEAQGQDK